MVRIDSNDMISLLYIHKAFCGIYNKIAREPTTNTSYTTRTPHQTALLIILLLCSNLSIVCMCIIIRCFDLPLLAESEKVSSVVQENSEKILVKWILSIWI